MNISEQIIKVLNELSNKLGVGVDWTQQNILPQIKDLINRYAQYKLYSSIMWLIIGLISLSISIIFFIKIRKEKKKEYPDNNFIWSLGFWFYVMLGVGGLITIFQIDNIIQIITIPETYFIHYIQQLLSQNL